MLILLVLIILLAVTVYLVMKYSDLDAQAAAASIRRIPYSGTGLPTMVNVHDPDPEDYKVVYAGPPPMAASRPGASSLVITHKDSINPFRKDEGTYDAVRYRLGTLLGGNAMYSIPLVTLQVDRKPVSGQATADKAYLTQSINVVCGGEFQVDSVTQELALVVRRSHLPQDDGSFLNYADLDETDNGPLNPSSWTFRLEYVARNGVPHDADEDGVQDAFFDETDEVAPLAVWRTA